MRMGGKGWKRYAVLHGGDNGRRMTADRFARQCFPWNSEFSISSKVPRGTLRVLIDVRMTVINRRYADDRST